MANLNKVMLIGRLTRDPEIRTFPSGGKVAAFGFAVNNKRKNASTGQWEDDAVFLDMEAFNRGTTGRQLADIVEQYFHKGKQYFIEGHLKLDQWTAQDGQKRSRLKIIVDNFEFLEPAAGEGGARNATMNRKPAATAPSPGGFDDPGAGPTPEMMEPPPEPRGEDDIPF